MMFRRAKTASAGATPASIPAIDGAGSHAAMVRWYLDQAMAFERSKQDMQRRLARLALIGGGALAVLGVAGVLGATAITMLKRPNPPAVLRVDKATGAVDVLDVAVDGKVSFGEMSDRADLRRYVEQRESYDWETIQSMYDATALMSDEKEREQYAKPYQGEKALHKVLQNQVRVIARVSVVTFVGTTAQVFFSKETIPLTVAAKRHTEYWVATIAYKHENLPERKQELEINPTGFRVTSYTVDRDYSRTDASPPSSLGTGAAAGSPTATYLLPPTAPADAGAAAPSNTGAL
jgi:type IV secretion system protein VirB8